MEIFVSVLSFLKSFFPEKSIMVFDFNKSNRSGEYSLCVENKTKKDEVIKRLEINGVELNKNMGVGDKREFPINLNPLSKLCWRFYLTKDNHYERPRIITVFTKSFWGTREKKYTI